MGEDYLKVGWIGDLFLSSSPFEAFSLVERNLFGRKGYLGMPKHGPSFKNLISQYHNNQGPNNDASQQDSRSVNDLLSNSRVHRPVFSTRGLRDVPPHLSNSAARYGIEATSAIGVAWIPIDLVEGKLFRKSSPPYSALQLRTIPIRAEILREQIQQQRRVERRTAGPAPPRSWNTPTPSPASSEAGPSEPRSRGHVSRSDLVESAALLSYSQNLRRDTAHGAGRLIEYTLRTVLRYLEDDRPLQLGIEEGDEGEGSGVLEGGNERGQGEGEQVTMSQIMREGVSYLDTHLKSALLEIASLQPENVGKRLSNESIRSIFTSPPRRTIDEINEHDKHNGLEPDYKEWEWETSSSTSSTSLTLPSRKTIPTQPPNPPPPNSPRVNQITPTFPRTVIDMSKPGLFDPPRFE